jgi:hypothetical protein
VFFTLPTVAVTGHISISSAGNGRRSAARSSGLPSQPAKSSGVSTAE